MRFIQKRERKKISFPFIRTPILYDQCPIYMISFDFNDLLHALSPNTVTLGARASTYGF